MSDEDERATCLLDAQRRAEDLFAEVEARGLIAAGRGERAASDVFGIWPARCSV